ncbi:VOC family protein [Aurantivibrio plasticivorans]
MTDSHEKINYLELPARDILATKTFFSEVFSWRFEDYGPQYSAFFDAGLDGGFYQSEDSSTTANGAALIVFYSENLDATQKKIEKAGGLICKHVFSFPGGRRFHFKEPSGNEFAVWSDKE